MKRRIGVCSAFAGKCAGIRFVRDHLHDNTIYLLTIPKSYIVLSKWSSFVKKSLINMIDVIDTLTKFANFVQNLQRMIWTWSCYVADVIDAAENQGSS